MKTRAFEFGTRRAVRITHIDSKGDTTLIVCDHDDALIEASLLLTSPQVLAAMKHRPGLGQIRTLEFRRGGPTGGYWAMLDEPPLPPARSTSHQPLASHRRENGGAL